VNQSLQSKTTAFPIAQTFTVFTTITHTHTQLIFPGIHQSFLSVGNFTPAGVATDKDCVIVDDLVQTGGTLIECAKVKYQIIPVNTYFIVLQALQRANPKSISLFVTHAVFPQGSWKKFTTEKCEIKFSHFWITDSIPHAIEIAQHKPFELLSLCDSISNSLFSYDLLSDTQ